MNNKRYLATALLLASILVLTTALHSARAATTALISISGVKYNDLNSNGTRDAGETGLSGWTIYLDLNSNSQLDAGEPSAVTDASGLFTITGSVPLVEGSVIYPLREVGKPNWTQTQAPPPLSFPPADYSGLAFGNHFTPPPAEVPESDTLWLVGAGGIAMVLYVVYRRKTQSAPAA